MASGIVVGRVSVKSAGVKRATRSFVDNLSRPGKRLFADQYKEDMRSISATFVDNLNLGEIKKVKVNNIIHDHGDYNPYQSKQFGIVYTRKRKRVLGLDGDEKPVIPKKARSVIKRIPRLSLFDNCNSGSVVPVPGVRAVAGYDSYELYDNEDYVPFMQPESYISSRGDEVSRTLERSYAVYDMDSDDEQWLKKKLNHEGVSVTEDVFERVISAFEKGVYCSPRDYSEAKLAVDRCLGLASKEVLEHVYSYWIGKRKKRRSALVRVFQCYKPKRVKSRVTSAVFRKKRSIRRQANGRFAEKPRDLKQAMLNDEMLLEESTKAHIKVQKTREAAKRLEEASIVKRQQAQALMEAADLAVYRATMALKIAEAIAAGGSVESVNGAAFGSLVE